MDQAAPANKPSPPQPTSACRHYFHPPATDTYRQSSSHENPPEPDAAPPSAVPQGPRPPNHPPHKPHPPTASKQKSKSNAHLHPCPPHRTLDYQNRRPHKSIFRARGGM